MEEIKKILREVIELYYNEEGYIVNVSSTTAPSLWADLYMDINEYLDIKNIKEGSELYEETCGQLLKYCGEVASTFAKLNIKKILEQ